MDLADAQRLPCGCVMGKHLATGAFVMVPCSETCSYYAYAITEARKQNKPIGQLDLRTKGKSDEAPALSPIFSGVCPYCGARNDGYTGKDRSERPEPGDISVCAYCKRVALFTEHGLRKPTDEESEALKDDPQIQAFSAAAAVVWKGGEPQ